MSRQASPAQVPVQYVKGVGPARAVLLKRLGVETVTDLLWTIPRRYEDRRQLVVIRDLIPGEVATTRGQVLTKGLRRLRGGRTIVEAAVGDATGVVVCRWFNQPYLAQQLRRGEALILHGRIEAGKPPLVIHPEIERVAPPGEVEGSKDGGGPETLHMGRIVPVYPLTAGVGQRWLRTLVHRVAIQSGPLVPEVLPEPIRRTRGLTPVGEALSQIHFPQDWERLEAARRRLAFEELFILQARLALRRARWLGRRKPHRYRPVGPLTRRLWEALPFSLTRGQQQAFAEVLEDLGKPSPMLRMLHGEVGCGKTVVAASAMAVALESGYQVALMAPTELLAEQHHRVLSGYFEPLGVRVGVLAQGVSANLRERLLADIARGDVGIVVGTHALLQTAVTFARLALVVIDEQHKFGVVQRTALVRKTQMPDVLVMTATPIPRTLALSAYGDLACSTIADLPPGRPRVRTVWHSESERPAAYAEIREELRRGRQGYVVYPVVGASDRRALRSATEMAGHLREEVFPEYEVALLHGQLPSHTQRAIMGAFVEGRAKLLVSTVIVEVGLDVANATVMLIEHPERFGLAQLHQLRGRIGRGRDPAMCLLISGVLEDDARRRLEAFVRTRDGFALAEEDLALRGPGELLGRRQHGWFRFRVADLARDAELLEAARADAAAFIQQDPALSSRDAQVLRERLRPGRSSS